jgi:hypothetical protein
LPSCLSPEAEDEGATTRHGQGSARPTPPQSLELLFEGGLVVFPVVLVDTGAIF